MHDHGVGGGGGRRVLGDGGDMEDGERRPPPRLNDRESAILSLLSGGLSNREMARTLSLSPLTVRNYISGLLVKFEARNRTDLLQKVIELRRQHHQRLSP